ncbi:MAG TPA: tail fiber protein [Armatimonadota bacterium]|jgi:microcystin-dependent protein
MDPFLGELRLVPYNFAPQGWAFCNGQILSIAQNTALFALLGTTYGGDGRTTFALPDLRGRVAISSDRGPGLTPRTLGEVGGAEGVTLLQTQMPAHNHLARSASAAGDQRGPTGHIPAREATGQTATYSDAAADGTLRPDAIDVAGGNQPHENMPPYLVMNYIIALQGIFPSRS